MIASRQRLRPSLAAACSLLIVCIAAGVALAHPGYPASALVHITREGRLTIHLRHDALAFALNETPADVTDEPMQRVLQGSREELRLMLDDAQHRLLDALEVRIDDRPLRVSLTDRPTVEAIDVATLGGSRVRLPIMLEFVIEADLPPTARSISLRFPEVMGDAIVTIERPGEEPFSLPLRPGEPSPAMSLSLPHAADAEQPAAASATAPQTFAVPSPLAIAWRYLVLGVEHIIPHGIDHMLFVLGLFLLGQKVRPLLIQITAFTVAHTITLALATLDVVRLPPEIVEPLIAASIALVAIENLFTERIAPWRPAVVFAFGLMHGLGFAGVLQDAGLPRGNLIPALVAFNIGVEIGQLTVIALALAAVGWWRGRKWYRTRIAIPASAAIAVIGVWWTIERVMNVLS